MNVMRYIPAGATQVVGRNILQLQKHSPKILFSAGLVGAVTSTVLACKATLKLEEVLEGTQKTLIDIDTVMDHPNYSDEDKTKDKAIVYTKAVVAIGKLYAPSIILGTLSISCLVGSHHILTSRNTGLMAAYAALEKGFDEYRTRVREDLGEDKERELRYGSEVVTTKDADGKKVKATRVASGEPSVYARFFDQMSPSWERRPELNKLFLKCQQQYANDKLHADGYLFLNDVYEMLGIPRSSAGQIVGWLIGKDRDNYVDFGIFDGTREVVREFVNGANDSILLDFNVDGQIYNLI